MSAIVRAASLIGLWVLLWGDISVANVAGGAAVAIGLLALYPTRAAPSAARPAARVRIRPLRVVRLAGHVVVQLVVSNAVVAREIVTPGSRIRTGIVACPLRTRSDGMVALVANVLALSPGTMPVDVVGEPRTLYVHVLHLRDPARTRRDVAALEALAICAFGSPEDLASLAGRPAGVFR